MITHLILYVRDQKQSTAFYSHVLRMTPALDVPGMTEFKLSETCILGLMPEQSIKNLLGHALPDPARASGIPRAELYLRVEGARDYHTRALENGAKELSPFLQRDWGERAAYSLDLDGHVLAFAEVQADQVQASDSQKHARLPI